MATAYIVAKAGTLRGINKTLRFEDIEGNITKIFPQKVNQIVIAGNVGVTGTAFSILAENHIEVCFLKSANKARLIYGDPKNGFLRHKQHLLVEDLEWVLLTAKAIVKGKITNEIHFLQRLSEKKGNRDYVKKAMTELHSLKDQVHNCLEVDTLRGVEGRAAKLYFDCLGLGFSCDWISFKGRYKNPPRDEVNAILSFLYTILSNRISTLIEIEGLDGFVGTLHAFSYGRDSLACDLIEEFRTPFVDKTVLSMFNKGQLTLSDFEYTRNQKDEVIVLLNGSGRKKAIAQFEKRMDGTHFYVQEGKTMKYREILGKQIHAYKKYVLGELPMYKPFEVI